jgi:hypothetical protein
MEMLIVVVIANFKIKIQAVKVLARLGEDPSKLGIGFWASKDVWIRKAKDAQEKENSRYITL